MSTCVRLNCCLPDPFVNINYAEKTEYLNVELVLSCGDGSTTPAVVIPAGSFASYDSQDAADRLALAEAQIRRSVEPCIWTNAQQSFTATCTEGSGTKTVTVSAGTYSSTESLAAANALALDEATQQAQEQLVCT